jgi:hypothetical protein
VQFNQVVLKWKPARTARAYRIYMWGTPENVVAPEHLYATVSDTTLIVPISDIPYREFYFQVTATK